MRVDFAIDLGSWRPFARFDRSHPRMRRRSFAACGASPCQGARLVFAAAFKEAARQDLKRTACVLVGAIASFELRAGTDVSPTTSSVRMPRVQTCQLSKARDCAGHHDAVTARLGQADDPRFYAAGGGCEPPGPFGNMISPFPRGTPIGCDDAFDGVIVVAAAPSRDTAVYKPNPADIPFTTCNVLSRVFRGVDRIKPKLNVADSLYSPRRAHNCADFLATHAEP
jgi:hypothetical protein